MSMNKKSGTLYLVATPIGNLSDISPRAIETIKNADIVAAEDTRHSGILIKKLGLSVHLESYHEHNKISKGIYLTEKMKEGLNVALVSDAGMPCISDPGNDLVKICTGENIPVVVIPGPCAAISAVSGSELDTSRFVFEGFIPVKGSERKRRIEEISNEGKTTVIYEAPHRILKTLKDLEKSGMGQRRITIARELTKIYEEFIRMDIKNAIEYYTGTKPKGEFVIVIEGKNEFLCRNTDPNATQDQISLDEEMEKFILKNSNIGLSVNDIAKLTANKFSVQKKQAYKLALSIKNKGLFDK